MWGPGGFGNDFLTPYVADWLRWTGIDDISEIGYHPTIGGDVAAARAQADAKARDIAKSF